MLININHIYAYIYIYIYIYVYIQNGDNVTMYYYMSCIFIACILKCVTKCNRCLAHLPYSVGVSYTRQPLAGDRKATAEHVCRDQVTLASPMLGRYTELIYTANSQCMVYCTQY